ncbi:hypothetical protein RB6163 [Rhodopirellula baltica SH 1]|uniref:Uncharacterized protein n=1 Tax=Rhodopirellula baltica (strain DSM 10527 / NCIMB 13988 / SH1) TaxID=243090 RepID=Q7UQQ4_RHOBA|nr:hypothetical protein RB6163 [Rhodopirellula baltica SH 1]
MPELREIVPSPWPVAKEPRCQGVPEGPQRKNPVIRPGPLRLRTSPIPQCINQDGEKRIVGMRRDVRAAPQQTGQFVAIGNFYRVRSGVEHKQGIGVKRRSVAWQEIGEMGQFGEKVCELWEQNHRMRPIASRAAAITQRCAIGVTEIYAHWKSRGV